MSFKTWTIGGAIGAATAIGGLWSAIHSDMLPVTRAAHAAAMTAIETSHAEQIEGVRLANEAYTQDILDAIKANHIEWRCDERKEELEEKLAEQAAGDSSPELAERIRVLRKFIDDNNCMEFPE